MKLNEQMAAYYITFFNLVGVSDIHQKVIFRYIELITLKALAK